MRYKDNGVEECVGEAGRVDSWIIAWDSEARRVVNLS